MTFPLYLLSRRLDGRSKRQNVTLKAARMMLYWFPRRCKSVFKPSVFAFPRLLRSRELKKYINETTGNNLKHVSGCHGVEYLSKEAGAYLKSSFRRMDSSIDGSIVKKSPALTPGSSVTRTDCCLVSAFVILYLLFYHFYLHSVQRGIPPYIPLTLYIRSTEQHCSTQHHPHLHRPSR